MTFLDKEDEDDMLSHPGLSRILGFRPYSLIGRRSVGGLPIARVPRRRAQNQENVRLLTELFLAAMDLDLMTPHLVSS